MNIRPGVTLCAAAMVAASMLCPSPSLAALRTKKIWMGQFAPAVSVTPTGRDFVQSPGAVWENTGSDDLWIGVAPLRLPAGARITGGSFIYKGTSEPLVDLSLFRQGFGSEPEFLLLGGASSSLGTVTEVPLEQDVGADLVVSPGYRYYLILRTKGAAVYGAKIVYRQ